MKHFAHVIAVAVTKHAQILPFASASISACNGMFQSVLHVLDYCEVEAAILVVRLLESLSDVLPT